MKGIKGLNWYLHVRTWCDLVSEEYNLPVYKVVGILSALSPRNKFQRNLDDTINLIEHGLNAKYGTFHGNRDKAIRILNAENIGQVVREFKNARKTYSFFFNIYRVYCNKATIDVHMIRFYKKHITTKSLTDKTYTKIENMMRIEANKLNIHVNQLQAIRWYEQRGELY